LSSRVEGRYPATNPAFVTLVWHAREVIRKRGKGYEVVVDLGRDSNGRRRQRSRMAPTKAAAKRLEVDLLAQRDEGRVADGDTAPLAHLYARWLERVPEDSTRYQARRSFERYVRPTLGATPIASLQPADLDDLYLAMARGWKGQRALSPSTINGVHRYLRAALGLGVRWGWISRNPAEHARPPAIGDVETSAPSPAVLRELLATATAVDLGLVAFLRFAANTGKRRGEVCALRRSDLDLEHARARIVRAIGVSTTAYVKPTKTRSKRSLTIGPATLVTLRAHLDAQDVLAAELGTTVDTDGYVFCSDPEGRVHWHPQTVSRRFAEVRAVVPAAAGVQLRQFRHFMATQGLELASPAAVAGRADHARESTTLDRYRAFLEPGDQALALALDEVIDGG